MIIKTIWHNSHHWRFRELPPHLRTWLLDHTSLTQRLQRLCGEAIQVEVLTQGWQRPLLTEGQRLGLPFTQYARIRQVYLCCQQQPWVFARTVIPNTTLAGEHRRLAQLGRHPLGSVLFAHPSLQRSEFQIACLHPKQPLYLLATTPLNLPPPSCLWGRRSIFYLAQKPLLVSEIFLPNLMTSLLSK